jgi:membrane associated rhomboid family serine protease
MAGRAFFHPQKTPRMRIRYNSPVMLTYTFLCVGVLAVSQYAFPPLMDLFSVGGDFGSFTNPLNYFRLLSHVAGHADWGHLIGNFTLILLIGPILEEKYGSGPLLGMMMLTACCTGILNIVLFETGLLGASGIAFMLIVLSSISNAKSGEIPLTFLLIAALFMGGEVLDALQDDRVSQFGHLTGGIFGAIFGFAYTSRNGRAPSPPASSPSS